VKVPRTLYNANLHLQPGLTAFTVKKGTQTYKLIQELQESAPHMSNLAVVDSALRPPPAADTALGSSRAAQLLRPYVNMTKAEFSCRLMDLKNGWTGRDMTDDERDLLSADSVHQINMVNLRVALKEAELARAFWVSLSDKTLLNFPESFVNLERVVVYKRNITKDTWVPCKNLRGVVQHMIEEKTFIFCGPPEMGKTPLARAIAKLYVEARGEQRGFIQTSTADSLRQCFVQGLMMEGSCLVMDEWKPGKESQDAKGGLCDFIKCFTDVENPGALALRYSDIKFPSSYPRLLTSQFSKEQWMQALITLSRDDLNAVLKRVLFMEVKESVIPSSLAKSFKGKKATDISAKMGAVMAARGVHAEPTQTTFQHDGSLGVDLFVEDEGEEGEPDCAQRQPSGVCVVICGMVASGKTTALKAIFPPMRGAAQTMPFRFTRYANQVVMLGAWREVDSDKYHFSGTDWWPRALKADTVATFAGQNRFQFVVAEGNRVSTPTFLQAMRERGYAVHVVHVAADPMVCKARRDRRATPKDDFAGTSAGQSMLNSLEANIATIAGDARVVDGGLSRRDVALRLRGHLLDLGFPEMLPPQLVDDNGYWAALDAEYAAEQDREAALKARLLECHPRWM
jgi:hypothetical protein